jgi:phosphoglucosamine mutase
MTEVRPNPEPTRKLFGTDGIRGTANVHPMTPEVALALGRAIAHVFRKQEGQRKQILIGKDTRLSGLDGGQRDPGRAGPDAGPGLSDP